MRSDILIIIGGMAAVTFIPRYLPFILSQNFRFHPRLRSFLSYIPVAALGALIIPEGFTAIPHMPAASIGGIIFAGIFSCFYRNIFLSVMGAIGVSYLIVLYAGG